MIISVMIRVRDAARELERCLSALGRQVLPDGVTLEIVVVDNDSKDDSCAVAVRHGAAVVPIARMDFTWGRALNRGIVQTHGEIVLLLSSDATPVDETWVQQMIEPFGDSKMAIVYGRQVPYPDAPVDERVRLARTFGEHPITLDGRQEVEITGKGMNASNACAAIRRSVWQETPYDEETSAGEEGPFTCQALRRGYLCRYQPAARAYHSHRDSPWRYACREWEILHKNAKYGGRPLRGRALLRWWAALTKRRLVNSVRVEASLYCRLCGVLRLPADLLACMVIGLLLLPEKSRSRVRQLFWR